MTKSQSFYDADLAYVHDVGFGSYAESSAPGLLETLREAGIEGGLVADLGCGSGIWAKRLVDVGYRVWGLDASQAMIDLARRRVPSAEFHVGSIWDSPLPQCRVVTAWGEVFCYRADGDDEYDLGALFQKIRETLEPGGLLIFDVAEVGLDRGRAPTFAEADDWACLVRFDYDEQRNRLIRHITTFRKVGEFFRRSGERHCVQLYRSHEVADRLRAVGFRVRTVCTLGGCPLLPNRIGFIAQRQ